MLWKLSERIRVLLPSRYIVFYRQGGRIDKAIISYSLEKMMVAMKI